MKIGNSGSPRLVGVPPEPRTGAKDADAGASSADGGSKSVNLSDLSKALSAMEGNDGVVDSQKVASIKAAIANGQFKVNANAVADGLVKSVQDLLSPPSGK